MRIGIDCRLWCETGVGRYIRNLVLNLQIIDEKNEYILFILSKDSDRLKIENSKVRIIKTDIRWHTLSEQIKFPSILNQENLDLMHFPYFSVPIFYNRPFVITIHDLIINHFSTGQASTWPRPIYGLKRLAYEFALSQAARKAKEIIAVSYATKDEIINHLKVNSNKIVVTHEGVSQKLSGESQKSVIDGNYFLYVGNAYPHKNIDRLLEVFKMLDNKAKLVFVGKEDYFYKRLRNKIREMGLGVNVNFIENANDEKLSNLYQNAKALILPSLMEGFGLPVLEAMVNKCLVLASDIPALREICGDAAIYFNPYDVNDMLAKISDVQSNNVDHYNGNKEKGLERVKLFSWRKMAKKTLKVYESCVGL